MAKWQRTARRRENAKATQRACLEVFTVVAFTKTDDFLLLTRQIEVAISYRPFARREKMVHEKKH